MTEVDFFKYIHDISPTLAALFLGAFLVIDKLKLHLGYGDTKQRLDAISADIAASRRLIDELSVAVKSIRAEMDGLNRAQQGVSDLAHDNRQLHNELSSLREKLNMLITFSESSLRELLSLIGARNDRR